MICVALPQELRARILREAQTAYPRECCGLLQGVRDGGGFHITALHPVRNLASAPDRFDMDPKDQFAAYKGARANGQSVIGCYHSHPDGRAEPSAADLAGAGEENFLWLIAGNGEIGVFVYAASGFTQAQLAGRGQPPL